MSTSGAARPFSNGGKRSNEKPSSKDAACISRQSQPEPSNQMSQTFSQIAKQTVRNALTTYSQPPCRKPRESGPSADPEQRNPPAAIRRTPCRSMLLDQTSIRELQHSAPLPAPSRRTEISVRLP